MHVRRHFVALTLSSLLATGNASLGDRLPDFRECVEVGDTHTHISHIATPNLSLLKRGGY